MRIQVPEIVEQELKTVIMQPGSLIKGTVLDVKKDWIVIDTHLKTESILPREQFKSNTGELEVNVGDEIELMLEIVENGYGKTQVSYEKARFMKKWLVLETIFKEGKIIRGLIKNKVRGGFTVDFDGIQAFLPSSLVDLGEPMDTSLLENTETDFKIIKIDRPRLNMVVSHKSISEGQTSNQKREYFKSLLEAGVVKGTVKRVVDYGAFIDLGKGEGLLHIGDIAWHRIRHPSDVLKTGEQYEFKIINYDKEKNHLSLSLREMTENPWQDMEKKFSVNQILEGTVTSVMDYGLFVEIAPKIEGLIHLTELNWINKSPRPANYAKVGDKIKVMVLKIDKEKCRLALGYKQCQRNPWQEYADKHSVGDIVEVKIKEIYDFGIFTEVAKNMDGFIHINNLDWDIPGTEAIKQYKKGQLIQAMITLINVAEERISLNIKKTKPNYLDDFVKQNPPKKAKVTCTITAIEKRRVIVNLSENVQGIIPARELSGDRMKDPADLVNIGMELEAQVMNFDKTKRIITLSPKILEKKEESKALASHRKKGGFLATLGDILHLRSPEEAAADEASQEDIDSTKDNKKIDSATQEEAVPISKESKQDNIDTSKQEETVSAGGKSEQEKPSTSEQEKITASTSENTASSDKTGKPEKASKPAASSQNDHEENKEQKTKAAEKLEKEAMGDINTKESA